MPEPAPSFRPTMGMLRELAGVAQGDPAPEMLEHWVCRQRGLVDGFGRLTADGDAVLRAELGRMRPHA